MRCNFAACCRTSQGCYCGEVVAGLNGLMSLSLVRSGYFDELKS